MPGGGPIGLKRDEGRAHQDQQADRGEDERPAARAIHHADVDREHVDREPADREHRNQIDQRQLIEQDVGAGRQRARVDLLADEAPDEERADEQEAHGGGHRRRDLVLRVRPVRAQLGDALRTELLQILDCALEPPLEFFEPRVGAIHGGTV